MVPVYIGGRVIAREDELEASGEEPHMRKISRWLETRQQAYYTDVSLRAKGILQLYMMWIPCFLMNATGGYIFGGMTAIKYILLCRPSIPEGIWDTDDQLVACIPIVLYVC